MRSFIFLGLMLLNLEVFGQYVASPDSLPSARNTLSINLTPASVLALHGTPNFPRFSMGFKRQLEPNFKLRTALGFEQQKDADELYSEAVVLSYTDSTITYRLDYSDHQIWDLRMGMEWFKPNRNISTVYGVDLILGLNSEEDGFATVPRFFNGHFETTSPHESPIEYTQNIDYFFFGFDFSMGQKMRVTDHLNFIIRWTPQIIYRLPLKEYYSDISLRTTAPKPEIIMNLRGLEVYLNVIF